MQEGNGGPDMSRPTIHKFIIEIIITPPGESIFTKIEITAPRHYDQDILDDLALSMASAILPGNPEIIYATRKEKSDEKTLAVSR